MEDLKENIRSIVKNKLEEHFTVHYKDISQLERHSKLPTLRDRETKALTWTGCTEHFTLTEDRLFDEVNKHASELISLIIEKAELLCKDSLFDVSVYDGVKSFIDKNDDKGNLEVCVWLNFSVAKRKVEEEEYKAPSGGDYPMFIDPISD